MKNKRVLILLICLMLVLTFTFAGCGSQGNTTPDADGGQDETTPEGPYTIDNIRDYVVGVDEPVELMDGSTRPLINFDNAATTPALKPVMDEVDSKLEMYGSIGRGFSIKQKQNDLAGSYIPGNLIC